VNETYFLREEYQFRCLVDSILPEIVRHRIGSDAIRIWCIPSSSGEEPYSIAMYLLEHWSGIAEWDVEIISSDIDTSILRRRGGPLFRPFPAAYAGALAEEILQRRRRRVPADATTSGMR